MIILSIFLVLSIGLNVILILYASKIVKQLLIASETASEIFSRLDAYKTHLKDIYELQLFYGDKNLREVIEHTKFMMNYLNIFNEIHSFTQTELEDIVFSEEKPDAEKENED